MPKAKAEGNGSVETGTVTAPVESAEPEALEALDEGNEDRGDMVATVATVAVVGVAAAAFEAALLPGIVLGVAAVAVPRYFPKIGSALNPVFRSTVRGAYKLGNKTREMMAEAQEQFHDIAAEVHAEKDVAPVAPKSPAELVTAILNNDMSVYPSNNQIRSIPMSQTSQVQTSQAQTSSAKERAPRRVRHETKMRLLQVREVKRLTPQMVRIVVGGDALTGFISAAHDDHVKVFFPQPGQDKPVLPKPSPNGPVYSEGAPRPAARDYTPRRYDAAANTLTIDFVLHGDGPATTWAAQARPGDFLGVGGPRGSFIVPDDFDWYLLAGDETALPAIGRRLEELPAGARAIVVVEVASAAEEQRFDTRARVETHWLHRHGAGDQALLQKAIADLQLPPGDGYTWVAAEAGTAKALRRYLVDQRGLPKDRVKAAAYWKKGAVAVHETYDD
jgi:NADPH-dependent ferric siderophore reductase